MGQRLNLSIWSGGKLLANAYYHWSAYTSSAANITADAIEAYYEVCEYNPSKYAALPSHRLAVRMLYGTGAGFYNEELNRIEEEGGRFEKYGDVDYSIVCNNRNEGLISITEYGMNETERWEEGRVDVHLDTLTVNFEVLFAYDREEYDEYLIDNEDAPAFDDYPLFEDLDVGNIPFDEFGAFIDRIGEGAGFRTGENWLELPIE